MNSGKAEIGKAASGKAASGKAAETAGLGRAGRAVKVVLAAAALGGLVAGAVLIGIVRVMIAAAVAYVILRLGLAMLRGLARPLPEPPEPGLLRKVKLQYRCEICGAEVRMTVAAEEDPEPPRHCQDEMTLITPID